MRGRVKALSNTGCPWPGGEDVEFHQTAMVALGKLSCWGSACIQFIARLADGREVFVRADKQSKEDEKFLRRLARKVPHGGLASRETGWRTSWMVVS